MLCGAPLLVGVAGLPNSLVIRRTAKSMGGETDGAAAPEARFAVAIPIADSETGAKLEALQRDKMADWNL